MYGDESWTVKKAEHWRIDALELWCWRRLLRVPWTARISNQLEDTDAGKDWRQGDTGMIEDEVVGWHHQLNGHGFRWTPGVGDGQEGMACCSPWGRKESDMTEWLNWTEHSGYLWEDTGSFPGSQDRTMGAEVMNRNNHKWLCMPKMETCLGIREGEGNLQGSD